jgi:preprotein translocase subunit YajC
LQSEPHSIKLTFAVAAEVLEIHNLIFIIFLFFLSAEQQQQQQQDPDRRSSLEQE